MPLGHVSHMFHGENRLDLLIVVECMKFRFLANEFLSGSLDGNEVS
jgi:hypothetical protein